MTILQIGDTIITGMVLISHVFLVLLGILFFFQRSNACKKMWSVVQRHAWGLAFSVSLTAMLGSLFYQHVGGHDPCLLCWWQRIFIYPQVFMLLAAKYLKLKNVFSYILILSSIGLVIAGYHYGLQLHSVMNSDFTSTVCSATDAAKSCAKAEWFKFGYITIPFMSLTAFLLQMVWVRAGRNKI